MFSLYGHDDDDKRWVYTRKAALYHVEPSRIRHKYLLREIRNAIGGDGMPEAVTIKRADDLEIPATVGQTTADNPNRPSSVLRRIISVSDFGSIPWNTARDDPRGVGLTVPQVYPKHRPRR